jgi:hypothetical protein
MTGMLARDHHYPWCREPAFIVYYTESDLKEGFGWRGLCFPRPESQTLCRNASKVCCKNLTRGYFTKALAAIFPGLR